MVDCKHIIERNRKELSRRLDSYQISYSIDHLVEKMKIIYVNDDKENQRLRLLGVERQYQTAEETNPETGEIISTEKELKQKVKKAQIYVMKKKEYEKLEESAKTFVMNDMNTIIALIHQLQTIKEVEELENKWSTGMYRLSNDFFTND